jgi:hypothetical protein
MVDYIMKKTEKRFWELFGTKKSDELYAFVFGRRMRRIYKTCRKL